MLLSPRPRRIHQTCPPLLLLLATQLPAAAQGGGARSGADSTPKVPHASDGTVGSTTWGVQLGYYDVSDSGGGNPFVAEDVTVIEPVIYFDYQATEDVGYWAMLSYDWVSSASIERTKRFGLQGGASGDYYAGLDVGMRRRLDEERSVGAHFGVSKEYDYLSIGLGGDLTLEAQDRNSSWSFGLNGYFDQLDLIRWDGREDGTDERFSVAGSVGYYRVLSPLWHAQFGLTLSNQSGYLETPINSVVIEDDALAPNPDLIGMPRGTEADEQLPDERQRVALHGRARRAIGPYQAFEIGGRLYDDSWGIQAISLQPGWIWEVMPDHLLMRLHYRYYQQSAADAFSDHLTSDLAERTQDPELGDLDSHTYSASFVWMRPGGVEWDFGLSFMDRSDDLEHIFGMVGWHWSH
ncbi:MAG: hypothetical protein ACI841_003655 [Planctomycetota bacterium]